MASRGRTSPSDSPRSAPTSFDGGLGSSMLLGANHVGVTQLVECEISILAVEGSNPSAHPKHGPMLSDQYTDQSSSRLTK